MKRRSIFAAILLLPIAAVGLAIAYGHIETEAVIAGHRHRIITIGREKLSPAFDEEAIKALPDPVRRYFQFVFRATPKAMTYAEITASGQFRRPLNEGFEPTTSRQILAAGSPALVFDATAHIFPGFWARAFDAYGKGQMEMTARLESLITVVNERSTPALNRTSLQRWLLESPLNPVALLPGGPVRWEAMDATRARAIVSAHGLEASLVATFRADGSLEAFAAEQDGDLGTPYHGAGEYALRENYQMVGGMMIPMDFMIARRGNGRIIPFWRGHVTNIRFE